MQLKWCLFITLILILLIPTVIECKKMRGGRRKTRKNNVQRILHVSTSKRKEHENGAEILKASHFDYEFFLGHKIKFICMARGDPVPTITWFKDGIEIFAHPYLQISEWKLTKNRIKSKLEIDPARQMDSGTYECQANNRHSVDGRVFKADF